MVDNAVPSLSSPPKSEEFSAAGTTGTTTSSSSSCHEKQFGVRGGSSRFRGVSWYKPAMKWVAQVNFFKRLLLFSSSFFVCEKNCHIFPV
jgi:hypothetical protein